MDTPLWNQDFSYNGLLSVQVSCHVGDNGSRAFCNVIGDQPLFYMDDHVEDDDLLMIEDEAMMMEQLSSMDRDFLTKMRKKIDAYENTAKSLSQFDIKLPEQEFDAIFAMNEKITSIQDVLDFGHQSDIFQSYHTMMENYDIEIVFDVTTQTAAFDKQQSKILVNPNQTLVGATKSCLQSMRTAWLDKNGILLNPLLFMPEEAIIINRIQKADLDITAVAYAWDLKLAGHNDLWASEMCGPDADLYSSYAMEAMTDFRAIKNGLALRSTFEKWFISNRCKAHDRQIIQIMMGGHSDIEINDGTASYNIAVSIIANMGRHPMMDNYLSLITTQIMNDTLYTDVRDRSNANFLWFVSFERRMANMEQELQDGETVEENTPEINHDNVVTMPQGFHHDNAATDNDTGSLYVLDHFRV